MSFINAIAEGLKAFLMSKVPMASVASEYCTGQRVQYIAEENIVPEHIGTVIRTWNDRVKVHWDDFEMAHWIESEAIKEVCGR